MEFRPLGPIRHARLAGSLLSWNFIMGECLLTIVSIGYATFVRYGEQSSLLLNVYLNQLFIRVL